MSDKYEPEDETVPCSRCVTCGRPYIEHKVDDSCPVREYEPSGSYADEREEFRERMRRLK